MFYPDPAYVCSLRAGGPTHFLAPGKGGSPLSTPSRPTPHDVGTSGVRPCADPTPPATASHRLPNSQTANGARSRRAAPLSQYVTEPGDRIGQIKLLWALASWCARTGGRRPFSEGAAVPVCSWLRTNWRAPPLGLELGMDWPFPGILSIPPLHYGTIAVPLMARLEGCPEVRRTGRRCRERCAGGGWRPGRRSCPRSGWEACEGSAWRRARLFPRGTRHRTEGTRHRAGERGPGPWPAVGRYRRRGRSGEARP